MPMDERFCKIDVLVLFHVLDVQGHCYACNRLTNKKNRYGMARWTLRLPKGSDARRGKTFLPARGPFVCISCYLMVLVAIAAHAVARAEDAPPPPPMSALPLWAQATTPPVKRALLIGIGDYSIARKLKTPRYDAEIVEQTLRQLDDTIKITRIQPPFLSRDQLLDAIDAFTSTIEPGDIVFMFFSGHGLESDGVNYIVPGDARIAEDGREGIVYVSLPYILEQFGNAKAGLSIVILDACRVDPFSSDAAPDELETASKTIGSTTPAALQAEVLQPVGSIQKTESSPSKAVVTPKSASVGLAEVYAPRGFMVAYAAAAGKSSYSLFRGEAPSLGSIFTRTLSQDLIAFNKPFDRIFDVTSGTVSRSTQDKQTPFLNKFDAGEVMLSKNNNLAKDEEETWRRTVGESPPDQLASSLLRFLDLYPAGPYSNAARKHLVESQVRVQRVGSVSYRASPTTPEIVTGALRTPIVTYGGSRVAVTNRDVWVRSSPRASAPVMAGALRKGDPVEVLAGQVRPGWAQVMLPDGKVGYVGSVASATIPNQDPRLTSTTAIAQATTDLVKQLPPDFWKAIKQPTYSVRITAGEISNETPWRAREQAYLQTLRLRSSLLAKGVDSKRITLKLDSNRLAADTAEVTAIRATRQ